MNDFNELNLDESQNKIADTYVSKEEQDKFNKKFLVKLMLFMFFYRFYIMHIDQKGAMVDFAENCFNDLSNALSKQEQEREQEREEELIIDEVD
jgi:hypothetical protein